VQCWDAFVPVGKVTPAHWLCMGVHTGRWSWAGDDQWHFTYISRPRTHVASAVV